MIGEENNSLFGGRGYVELEEFVEFFRIDIKFELENLRLEVKRKIKRFESFLYL